MKHDNWYNEEYMNHRRSEVIQVANEIIDKKIGIIEGVRKLRTLHHEVSEDDFDPDFIVFTAIDSETDHLPVGEVRKYWSSNALEIKDREINDAEECYREQVFNACKILINRFGKNL
jgi:hypothetical protein